MRYVVLLVALSFWPAQASTRVQFDLQSHQSTVIRFFSIGWDRQLHVGVTTKVIEPDKNAQRRRAPSF